MPTGFPAATGDVLSAAMYNGLVNFTTTTNTNDATALWAQSNKCHRMPRRPLAADAIIGYAN